MHLSETNDISVNGTAISQDVILAEMQYHQADTAEAARYSAAEALVIRELLLQRAFAADCNVFNGEELDEEATIEALLVREVAVPKSSDEEIQRYFDNNRNRFKSEPLLEASHILLSASAEDSEGRADTLKHAEILLEQLQKKPASFSKLALKYSACPSKETGGSLGQLSKGSTVPEFERQIFSLKAGLCQTPIESRYGFHLVRVDRKIEGRPLPLEMVKEQISNYLKHKVERRAFRNYIQELMESAEITGIAMDSALSAHIQ